MEMSKFVGQNKPSVEDIPGFRLVYNKSTNRWAYRPEKGYSDNYLDDCSFVPDAANSDNVDSYEDGKSKNMLKAKKVKNDEFYTRFQDISDELVHYKDFFRGKSVYCPCDKAFNIGRSEFFNFFLRVFDDWGIKKIVSTQYCPNGDKRGYMWVVENTDGLSCEIDESDIDTYLLDGDGSFESPECVEIMRSCDIVVTNPPFSLFRKFVSQIIDLGKQFVLIGNENSITYKDFFPYIKDNKVWLGYNHVKSFKTTLKEVSDSKKQYMEDGCVYQKFGNICWFTNIRHKKRTEEEIDLYVKYSEETHPKYDEYDAIDCGRLVNGEWQGCLAMIPCDYYGKIGVPITFLNAYNPNQFEIINLDRYLDDNPHYGRRFSINGKETYARIIIKRRA